jgi:proteasome lid subunit RPN8/RPN11
MVVDPTVERGCLLTNEFELITFDNISKTPEHLIEVTPEVWNQFADLMMEDNLYGWIHSHPFSLACPSTTDIKFHQFPCNMIIYSVRYDHFTEWTPDDIEDLEAGKEIDLIEYKEKIIHGEPNLRTLGSNLRRESYVSGLQPRGCVKDY